MSDQDRPSPGEDKRKLVELTILENPVEGSALTALLQERGIASTIDSWHSTPFDGIFETQKGFAKLLVFEENLREAQEILEDCQRSLAESAGAAGDADAEDRSD